jgi:hypothetical protein
MTILQLLNIIGFLWIVRNGIVGVRKNHGREKFEAPALIVGVLGAFLYPVILFAPGIPSADRNDLSSFLRTLCVSTIIIQQYVFDWSMRREKK